MTIWLDAHLPPKIAPWLAGAFNVTAVAVRDLGLRAADDSPIFAAKRGPSAIICPPSQCKPRRGGFAERSAFNDRRRGASSLFAPRKVGPSSPGGRLFGQEA